MKGIQIQYSQQELAWIESNKTMIRKKAHALFCKKFSRSDVSLKNYNGLCKRKGWLTGRTGCFIKGQESHNKGKKQSDWMSKKAILATKKTQFKKGNTPHNTNYLGHERASKDGYIEISIDEVNPHTGYERRYVLKHRHLWQQINGQIPEGHALKCMDGDKSNCDPSNWILIDRSLLPSLAVYKKFDQQPQEIKPSIIAIENLKNEIRRRSQP